MARIADLSPHIVSAHPGAVRINEVSQSDGEKHNKPCIGNACHLCRPLLDFSFFLHRDFCFSALHGFHLCTQFTLRQAPRKSHFLRKGRQLRHCCAAATSDWIFDRGFLAFSRPPSLSTRRLWLRFGIRARRNSRSAVHAPGNRIGSVCGKCARRSGIRDAGFCPEYARRDR